MSVSSKLNVPPGCVGIRIYTNMLDKQTVTLAVRKYVGTDPNDYSLDGYRLTHVNSSIVPFYGMEEGKPGKFYGIEVQEGDMLQFTKSHEGIEVLVAAAIIAAVSALAAAGAIGVTSAIIVGVLAIGSAVASHYLQNQADPGNIPETPKESPHYSWQSPSNRSVLGGPFPILMGECEIFPNLVARRERTNDEGDSVLDLLYLLSEGPIESIGDKTEDFNNVALAQLPATLKINGVDASTYPEVRAWGRLGESTQTAIPGFSDDVNEYLVEIELEQDEVEVYTTEDPCEGFVIVLQWTKGLFQVSATGDTEGLKVDWQYRYKKDSDVEFSAWIDVSTKGKNTSAYKTFHPVEELEYSVYNIEVRRVSKNWTTLSKNSTQVWYAVQEITPLGLTYPGCAILALRAIATRALNGQDPQVSIVCKGVKVDNGTTYTNNGSRLLKAVFTEPHWGGGAFLYNTEVDEDSVEDAADYCDELIPKDSKRKQRNIVRSDLPMIGVLNPSAEGTVVDSTHTYYTLPAMPATGTKYCISSGSGLYPNHIATFNGSTWDFTAPVKDMWITDSDLGVTRAYDGSAWVTTVVATGSQSRYVISASSTYNAKKYLVDVAPGEWDFFDPEEDWIVYDESADDWLHFTSGSWATGYSTDNLMKRWEFNAYIDFQTNLWDMALRIAKACRLSILRTGDVIKIVPFRPVDLPTQIFGEGDIKEGTFNVGYPNPNGKANSITVEYRDEDDGYALRSLTVESSLTADRGVGRVTQSYSPVGITNRRRAINFARHELQSRQLSNRVISFETNAMALVSEPSDVIGVSAKLPQWGYSGYLTDTSTENVLILDQVVPFDRAKEYVLALVYSDGTILNFIRVENPGGQSSIVRPTQPEKITYSVDHTVAYMIGELRKSYKPMQLSRVDVRSADSVMLEGPEYYPELVDDDYDNMPLNTRISDLTPPSTNPTNPSSLTVREVWDAATNTSYIEASWPEANGTQFYKLWYRKTYLDDDVYYLVASTTENSVKFKAPAGNPNGPLYTFAVASVSWTGTHTNPDSSTKKNLHVFNFWIPPASPIRFEPFGDYAARHTSESAEVPYPIGRQLKRDRLNAKVYCPVLTGDTLQFRLGKYWHCGLVLLNYDPEQAGQFYVSSAANTFYLDNYEGLVPYQGLNNTIPYLMGQHLKVTVRSKNTRGILSTDGKLLGFWGDVFDGIADPDQLPLGPKEFSPYIFPGEYDGSIAWFPYGESGAPFEGISPPGENVVFHPSGLPAEVKFAQPTTNIGAGTLSNLTYSSVKGYAELTNKVGRVAGSYTSGTIDLGSSATSDTPWYVYIFPEVRQVWNVEDESQYWDNYVTMDGPLNVEPCWWQVEYRYSDDGMSWSDWVDYIKDNRTGIEKISGEFGNQYYGHRLGNTSRYLQVRVTLQKPAQNMGVYSLDGSILYPVLDDGTEPFEPVLENIQIHGWR